MRFLETGTHRTTARHVDSSSPIQYHITQSNQPLPSFVPRSSLERPMRAIRRVIVARRSPEWGSPVIDPEAEPGRSERGLRTHQGLTDSLADGGSGRATP